jgi:hypothetical protein
MLIDKDSGLRPHETMESDPVPSKKVREIH